MNCFTEPDLRFCKGCRHWKVDEDFGRTKMIKSGRMSECKKCSNAYNKRWRDASREKSTNRANCLNCGKEFGRLQQEPDQQYCGARCLYARSHKERWDWEGTGDGQSTKRCNTCGIEKSLECYYYKYAKTPGYEDRKMPHPYCKDCARESHLIRIYGITLEQYKEKNEHQAGLCDICGLKDFKELAVDHNGDTGQVRALLCSKCNPGMGLFNHDPELLRKAADYLEYWNGQY